jgi:3-mercaptopyruvate sulfurtransferase SseA
MRILYENLLQRIGVRNDTVIVLYGDLTIGLQHLHSGC